MLHAIEPGISRFKTLFRYRIHRMKPDTKRGYWFLSASWLMLHHPSFSQGSIIWNRIISAWKKVIKYIDPSPPSNADEVLSTNFWWASSFIGVNFNFTPKQARDLAKHGLHTIYDLWDPDRKFFKAWEVISEDFSLLHSDFQQWLLLISIIPSAWLSLIQNSLEHAQRND